MNAKLILRVSPLLRLKNWVVRFFPRVLLFLLLLAGLSASGTFSPIPRIYAANSSGDANLAKRSTTFTRVAVRSTITWSGAGDDAHWSNPANWDGGVVPGPFDIARLSDSSQDAVVDQAFGDSVAGIVLDEGYGGTLRLARELVVRGDVVITSGMLVTPFDRVLNVITLDIQSPGVVQMGANGKLNITGDGSPLTGNGALDTMTNQPNSVEYTGAATSDLTAAGPLAGYRGLGLDKVGQDPRAGVSNPLSSPRSFSESSALTLNTGENYPESAVIDTANGFAYFGTGTSPGIVVKVRLSDFTRVGALTLNTGENYLDSAVIDTANGFAYFGTGNTPGKVVKVRLSDFTRVGALTLNTGEDYLFPAVIDTTNGFAYFGTRTAPGKVVKVRLSDFTRVGALTLNTGENILYSAVIDTANGFAYFGTGTAPGKVVKVRLSDFTRVGALTLNTGEDYLYSAVIDTTNGFAYFGTYTFPGIVVKVRLSDFTRVGALTLNTGENVLWSAVIAPVPGGGFAYFGTYTTSPSKVVKVRLSDFTRVGALTLNTGEDYLASAVIDTANGFAYFGTRTTPGIVVKVNVQEFRPLFLPLIMR